MIGSLCIFCGSRSGLAPAYRVQAERLGQLMGRAGVEIVFGGGHVGLMGIVADSAMKAGGNVVGFIPEHLLVREAGHRAISELIVTDSMFGRKEKMIARADGFVILPGGLGTLDEFFEVLTLCQLGQHRKPIMLINVEGFWDPLTTLIDKVVDEGFADDDVKRMIRLVDDVEKVLPTLGIGDRQLGIQAAS